MMNETEYPNMQSVSWLGRSTLWSISPMEGRIVPRKNPYQSAWRKVSQSKSSFSSGAKDGDIDYDLQTIGEIKLN